MKNFLRIKQKYARLQNANGRKGIVSSIQMITQFIFMGKVCPGGDGLFLINQELANFVDTVCASRRLPPFAAALTKTAYYFRG